MRHQLFCVAILLVFFYGSFCEGKESHHMGRSREIFLHNRVINTVEEAAHDDFSGSANGLFYVNFKPMFAAERKNILALEEASNGRLHFDSYLPMATYVLYAPMSAVAELSQNPNVLWIGAVKPEDKMPASFAKTLLDDRQEQEQEEEKKGFSPADDTTLTVLWSRTGASNTELEKEIAQVQAHMAKQFPSSLHFWTPVNRETHMSSLIISGANSAQQTSQMINWLLQEGSQRIRFIEPSAQNFPHSAFSTHVVVDGTYSCPTVEPLCDYNTYLGSGINGTGQIIGILDSGVDFNSCFFYDPSFTTDTSNPSARKIVYYQTNSGTGAGDATDGTGHGTFCAGLAVGTAADPSSDFTAEEIAQATTFNGIATGAQLYVVDVMRGVQQQLNIDIPNIGVAYLSPMNTAGARIVLIPWGSVVNLAGNKAFYSSQDNVFDTYTAQNPEFLVVASVGNLGLTSAGRITSPASSKNALAVGGSYNTHDSFLYTDYVPDLSIAAQHEYTKFCTIGALDNYYNEVFCTLMNQPTPCTSFQAVLCNSNFDGTPQGCCGLPYFAPICCPATVLNFWAASRSLYSPDSGYPESSRGPTYDGRIKPEVLAPANRLYSAYQSNSSTPYCGLWNDTPYDGQAVTVNEGTSGSASVVAGAAALVRQWLIDGYYPAGVSGVPESIPFPNPSAALIKAIMINSGDSLFQINANGASAWEALPNLGYDIQGFGRVNLKNVLNVDPVINNVLLFDNQIIPYTNYTLRYCIRVNDGSTYVRVTAVWTDPAAAVGAGVALVNNLDLVLIRDDGHEYRANRKIEFDSVNNVEDIWAPALAGRVYTIAVHGTYIPQGPQPVAIVVSGDFFCNNPSDCLIDSLFCTGPGSSCPMDCSLRGECFNGECFCEAPYMGIDCSLTPCPNNCNGNGVCDGETGACICNDFWKSYDCSVENPTGTTDFVCPPCQCSGGVNTGAVVGIAIGCFIIGVVIFFPLGVWVGIRLLLRRKKKLIAKARALNSNRSHREALAPADGLDEEEN